MLIGRLFCIALCLVLFAPDKVVAQDVSSCFSLSLDKPRRSGSGRMLTTAIRAVNKCGKPVFLSYTVCSNSKSISIGGGPNLHQKYVVKNFPVNVSYPYEYTQGGGFTYLNGSSYNFRYSASLRQSYNEVGCEYSIQNNDGSGAGDDSASSLLSGRWSIRTVLNGKTYSSGVTNINVSGRTVYLQGSADYHDGVRRSETATSRIESYDPIRFSFDGVFCQLATRTRIECIKQGGTNSGLRIYLTR